MNPIAPSFGVAFSSPQTFLGATSHNDNNNHDDGDVELECLMIIIAQFKPHFWSNNCQKEYKTKKNRVHHIICSWIQFMACKIDDDGFVIVVNNWNDDDGVCQSMSIVKTFPSISPVGFLCSCPVSTSAVECIIAVAWVSWWTRFETKDLTKQNTHKYNDWGVVLTSLQMRNVDIALSILGDNVL